MSVTCDDVKKHLLIHEIIGSPGGTDLPIRVDGGILSVFDEERNKFLSVDRRTFIAARHGRAKNIYLRGVDGISTSVSGYRMARNATIVSLAAESPATTQWQVHLRKNDDVTNLQTLVIASGGASDITVDVDLNAGDILQFYVETSAFLGIKNPSIWVEVAWRVI